LDYDGDDGGGDGDDDGDGDLLPLKWMLAPKACSTPSNLQGLALSCRYVGLVPHDDDGCCEM
jgi:hypothetical protein